MTKEDAIMQLEDALDVAIQIAEKTEKKIFIRKKKRGELRRNNDIAIDTLLTVLRVMNDNLERRNENETDDQGN